MSKTNEQGLTASQQELLLVWTGHMEATIAHVSDYEPLVTMGFAVRDVHPVTLETTYRATPAGIAVGHTIATLRAQAEALEFYARLKQALRKDGEYDPMQDALQSVEAAIHLLPHIPAREGLQVARALLETVKEAQR